MGFFTNLVTPAPIPVAEHSSNIQYMMDTYLDAFADGSLQSNALSIAAIYRARQLNSDVPASLPVNSGGVTLTDTADRIVETILSLQDHGDAYWNVDGMDWEVLPYDSVQARWSEDGKTREYFDRNGNQYNKGLQKNLKVLSVNRSADDLEGFGWMESGAVASVLAIDKYATEYFKNNGKPTGTLEAPGTLTKQESDRLKAQWVAARGAERTPAVLSGGIQFVASGFSAQDSDWVASHNATILDIASLSGVPAFFLSASVAGSSLTYTRTDDLWRMYWAQSLDVTWVRRIERAWTDILGAEVTFDPEELLIASMKDRVYSAAELVRTGWEPDYALDVVGLPPGAHTGEVPVTLQMEESTP